MIKADVLVIGSGISGLSYAIKIAETLPDAQITIVTKSDEDESNTKYAQGGLAVVTDFSKRQFRKTHRRHHACRRRGKQTQCC